MLFPALSPHLPSGTPGLAAGAELGKKQDEEPDEASCNQASGDSRRGSPMGAALRRRGVGGQSLDRAGRVKRDAQKCLPGGSRWYPAENRENEAAWGSEEKAGLPMPG